jgi:hypothetical protein
VNAVVLPVHRELLASSRVATWTSPADRLGFVELGVLVGAGVTAALAVSCLDFSLRIPGHAILRAVWPMALGLSLAPRRLGGVVMGGSACVTASLLKLGGGPAPGIGAMTSLCLIGPMLDVALWRIRAGWPVYLGFALAGGMANIAAFAVRGAGKLSGLDALTKRPLADWVGTAAWSYILCGVIAGLVSAGIWFRLRADRGPASTKESPA